MPGPGEMTIFEYFFLIISLALILSFLKTSTLILNEDNLTGSISGEIGSYIAEHGFDLLDAPVSRLGSLDTPVPANEIIEREIFWPKNEIIPKIENLIEY